MKAIKIAEPATRSLAAYSWARANLPHGSPETWVLAIAAGHVFTDAIAAVIRQQDGSWVWEARGCASTSAKHATRQDAQRSVERFVRRTA